MSLVKIEVLLETMCAKMESLEAKIDSLNQNGTKKEYVKKEGDGKVNMDKYKKGILVTGDTFPVKNTLSEYGGKWNKALNGWMFTNSHLQEVVNAIREDGVNLVIGDGIECGDE